MGGDDFNKSDGLNDFVGFAPVAKKQEQMNAEHASWLQESHLLNSDEELFNSISKKIIEAASKGLSDVILHLTHPCFAKVSSSQVINVLNKNGFQSSSSSSTYSRENIDWNLIGNWVPAKDGFVRITYLSISW